MFSSVASFLISAGHGNYATANAFLDALAVFRRSRGLTATTINWGPWAEIGLAAAQADRLERLGDRGLATLKIAEGLEALAALIRRRPTRVAVMHFDAQRWCAAPDLTTPTSLFERLLHEVDPDAAPADGGQARDERTLAEILRSVEAGPERRLAMETYLREQMAGVLRLSPARIDPNKAFRTMGLDSLMALELRNRLEARTGITIPATLVWNYPTIARLAAQLAVRIGVPLESEPDVPASEPAAVDASAETLGDLATLLGEIEELSDEDARRLLAE